MPASEADEPGPSPSGPRPTRYRRAPELRAEAAPLRAGDGPRLWAVCFGLEEAVSPESEGACADRLLTLAETLAYPELEGDGGLPAPIRRVPAGPVACVVVVVAMDPGEPRYWLGRSARRPGPGKAQGRRLPLTPGRRGRVPPPGWPVSGLDRLCRVMKQATGETVGQAEPLSAFQSPYGDGLFVTARPSRGPGPAAVPRGVSGIYPAGFLGR